MALKDGRAVVVRALGRADAEGVRGMLLRSSPLTLYSRFLIVLSAVSNELLSLLADPDREDGATTLLAVAGAAVVGHAMYARTDGEGGCEAEVALVVEDLWQARGVGKLLLSRRSRLWPRARAWRSSRRSRSGTTGACCAWRAVFSEVRCEYAHGSCFVRAPLGGLRPGPLAGEQGCRG